MTAGLQREAALLFGDDRFVTEHSESAEGEGQDVPEAARLEIGLKLSARQRGQLWEHVSTLANFWRSLPEIEPGIIARLADVARSRRWEVIFLTKRPVAGSETIQVESQRWLVEHGFALPSVFVVQGSRGRIADALELDAVVDDRPENCLDVAAQSRAKPILIWPGDQKAISPRARRLGVRVTASPSEALALLEQLDDLQKNAGVLRSLKRLFRHESRT